jgi:hypothetical protein
MTQSDPHSPPTKPVAGETAIVLRNLVHNDKLDPPVVEPSLVRVV